MSVLALLHGTGDSRIGDRESAPEEESVNGGTIAVKRLIYHSSISLHVRRAHNARTYAPAREENTL